MNQQQVQQLSISSFVILWGSAAIFSKWGLQHGSVLALLMIRFVFALILVLALCRIKGLSIFPQKSSWQYVALTGLLFIGTYSLLYFMSIDYGIAPGLLSTILALQPILTFFITEKHYSKLKLLGLVMSFLGIICLVYTSLFVTQLSIVAVIIALGCLAAITTGAILQRKIKDNPLQVMPLQYLVALLLFMTMLPFQSFHFEMDWNFWTPTLWLGLVISVIAQLILYRLLQSGNVVNVTSLFYLVPIVTLVLDYFIYQATLSALDVAGIVGILLGVYLVYRKQTP